MLPFGTEFVKKYKAIFHTLLHCLETGKLNKFIFPR